MTSRRSFRFYSISFVIYCFLLIIVTTGIGYNCWSVFTIPVCGDMSITRQQFSGLLTAILFGSMCSSWQGAKIIARFGLVNVMRAGAVLFALTTALSTLSQQAWHLYLIGFLMGYSYTATSFFTLSILISNWFFKKRGLVLGIVFMGSGLGSVVLIPLANALILNFGWRSTMLILSMILAVVALPICFFVIRAHPEEVGYHPYGADSIESNPIEQEQCQRISTDRILRQPPFWMLVAFTIGVGVIAYSGASIVPYLCDEGYSSTQAAAIQSLGMGSIAVLRILMGQIADRIGIIRLLPVSIVLSPLMLLGLLMIHATSLAEGCILIGYGVSQAVITVCMPLLTNAFMGKNSYAKSYGIISAVNSLIGAVTPMIQGTLYTLYGSYSSSYYLFLIIFVFSVLCFFLISRFFPQHELSGNTKGQRKGRRIC